MSGALAAAAALASSDLLPGDGGDGPRRSYKVLQAHDMRRFAFYGGGGDDDDDGALAAAGGEGVSCQAGSMDLMLGCDGGGGRALVAALVAGTSTGTGTGGGGHDTAAPGAAGAEAWRQFWALAREAHGQAAAFAARGWPAAAVGVFDWGMRVAEMTNLVSLGKGGGFGGVGERRKKEECA